MRTSRYLRSPVIFFAAAAFLFFFLSHSAPGAKSAAIRLPEDFAAASTRTELAGFSGYNRGSYTGAGYHGDFTRIESRLGVLDPLYVANRGKSSFTIEESEGTLFLSASCGALQRTVSVRFVTLDVKKLTYECVFSGADSIGESRFVLGEPKREGFKQKLLARDLRTGEAVINGYSYVFESIHEYQGSKLNSQSPLGYLILSEGIVIAAVDLLDWNPIVHLRDAISEQARNGAMTVALALAVLRDPANSALEN